MKVTVVGAGAVGASCAEFIAIKDFASDVVLFRSKSLGSKIYTPTRFFEFLDASNRPILSSILKSFLCQNIERNFFISYSRFGML